MAAEGSHKESLIEFIGDIAARIKQNIAGERERAFRLRALRNAAAEIHFGAQFALQFGFVEPDLVFEFAQGSLDFGEGAAELIEIEGFDPVGGGDEVLKRHVNILYGCSNK